MTEPSPDQPSAVSLRAGLLVGWGGVLLTGALAVLLHLALLPRGTAEWAWRFRSPPLNWGAFAAIALLATLLASLLTFEWVRAPSPPSRRACVLLLVVMILLGTIIFSGLALHAPGFPVSAPLVVLSDLATGYYTAAAHLPGPAEAFTGHCSRAEDTAQPDRMRTHPPGPILVMMGLRQVVLTHATWLPRIEDFFRRHYGLDAEDLARLARGGTGTEIAPAEALIAAPIAWLLTWLPVLIILPAYGLGAVLGDRRIGLGAALLALTLPSLLCFIPGIDGLGAVIALTALYLWAAALRRGHWWLYGLAGLGAAAALLWSFGYAALLLIALFLARRSDPEDWPQRLGYGFFFSLAGFALVYGILDATWGYNLWGAFTASMGVQQEIMVREQRGYLEWLMLNPYAFALFLGPALVLCFLAALTVRDLYRGPLAHLIKGLLLTLVLLALLGTTRGEVERIWVFLMPLVGVAVAAWLVRLPRQLQLWLPALLVLAQVAFALFLTSEFALVTPF